MRCIDRNLTNRQIFERIDKYSRSELTPKQADTFEKHFWNCNACYEALLLHKLTLNAVKVSGDQIFLKVKGAPEGSKEKIVFWLIRDKNQEIKVVLTKPDYLWSMDFDNPKYFELLSKKKKPFWKLIVYSQPSKTGIFHVPFQPHFEIVKIPDEPIELFITFQQKQDRVTLSIVKRNNSGINGSH